MIVYNQTDAAFDILGQTIDAFGEYAVPTTDQVTWCKDPTLRATVGIASAIIGFLSADAQEMVTGGPSGWVVMDAVADGKWLPQDQTTHLAADPKKKKRVKRFVTSTR